MAIHLLALPPLCPPIPVAPVPASRVPSVSVCRAELGAEVPSCAPRRPRVSVCGVRRREARVGRAHSCEPPGARARPGCPERGE